MTKEYINRELILHRLGYDLNHDIKKYKDFLHELIGGDSKNLKSEISFLSNSKGISYSINHKKLFFYEFGSKDLWISYENIWSKYMLEFDLIYYDIRKILHSLLEYVLNIKINFVVSYWF